jgi:hypothetical protein
MHPLYCRLHAPFGWVLKALDEAEEQAVDWLDMQQAGLGTACR